MERLSDHLFHPHHESTFIHTNNKGVERFTRLKPKYRNSSYAELAHDALTGNKEMRNKTIRHWDFAVLRRGSISAGLYMCLTKDENDVWWLCDDSDVQKASLMQFAQYFGGSAAFWKLRWRVQCLHTGLGCSRLKFTIFNKGWKTRDSRATGYHWVEWFAKEKGTFKWQRSEEATASTVKCFAPLLFASWRRRCQLCCDDHHSPHTLLFYHILHCFCVVVRCVAFPA